MKKTMITLVATFTVIGWLYASTTSPSNPLVIKRAQGTITIDGVGNEATWAGIIAVQVSIQKALKDPAFKGNFKLTYDDNNIYVLVNVTDPTPNNNGSTTWQSDCVELFFAMDTNSHDYYQPGDWQIRKIASTSQANGGVDGSLNVGTSLLADPNFKVEQTDYAGGYIQEWQIPIATLKQNAAFDGQNIRFEIHLANNDGTGNERTDQRFWNDGADDQWAKTVHMGYVHLSSALVDDNACTLYKDSLALLHENIQDMQQQTILLQAENIILHDSIEKIQQKLSQVESERNIITDSLGVLYNMLINNQSIVLLAFDEVTTSVATQKGNVGLHIYPNPAHDRMLIESSETIFAYSIYTTSGRLIFSTVVPATSQSPYAIQLPSLSSGLYSLQLLTSKGTIAVLFLKR